MNLHYYIEKAKKFCDENKLSTRFFILIDYSIPSGKDRFFVVDFIKEAIIFKTLTTHGSARGYNNGYEKCFVERGMGNIISPVYFSNKYDSFCSSLGKILINEKYSGFYGRAYRLDSLEEINSNIRKRCVVLHEWDVIPDCEVFPEEIIESHGCPAISSTAFSFIEKIIDDNPGMMIWVVE
ncbi:MAG: murein L,D-transpeptidase catalytic domain family protein [Bacteroidales bacterium]|nr:murein L,D-transpeptidase catalytic domain family protein [Bacteroidales bacterium]